ncbi:MAG: hypothetical protein H6993_06805 [Pseudomonadales bacterium]|nr:hypothetical protein [Pseudomonadales bacterium]
MSTVSVPSLHLRCVPARSSRVLGWLIPFVLCLWWHPAHAESLTAPKLPDVRLLFDVSADVQALDVDNLRAEAASLLLRLMPDDGRGGIWVYGDSVGRLVRHGQSDLLWKRLASIHVRGLEARGRRSDLPAALAAATWDLAEKSTFARHLIIVSDGRLKVGNDSANFSAWDDILNRLQPRLSEGGFVVHAVVLPGSSDAGLLRQLVSRTGGMFLPLTSVGQLGRQFEKLVQRTANPPTLPVVDGTFTVEPGLREMTLWRAGDDPDIELVDPAGDRHTRAAPGVAVRWHDARGYDVLSIADPLPGKWHFRGDSAAAVYAYGDTALRVSDIPATLFPGLLNHVDFMLFDGADAVTDPTFLAMFEAKAELVGEQQTYPLFVERREGGVFQVALADNFDGGSYQLQVSLAGPTFARSASVPFELANPVRIKVEQDGRDVVAYAALSDPSVDYSSLTVAAQVRVPPGARRLIPARSYPGGLWQVRVPAPNGLVEIAVSFYGHYQNQSPFQLHTQALSATAPLAEGKVFRFDIKGKALPDFEPLVLPEPEPEPEPALPAALPVVASAADAPAGEDALPVAAPERTLPGWFAGVAAGLNFAVALAFGWFLSRRRVPEALAEWLSAREPEPEAEAA